MSTAIGLRFAKCVARLTAWTIFAGSLAWGQQVPEQLYSEMKWRMIGPFRAGKVNAVAGVPGSPGIYYFGANGGGVWKTTDGGTVWKPIFDGEPVASIGALALAPSNSNIIYVGSGENNLYADITYGNEIHGCRRDLAASRTCGHAAHRANPD